MKYLFGSIIFCSLFLATAQAQSQDSYVRFGALCLYAAFAVQEASDDHLRPLGVRLVLSDYDMASIEFGINAYAKYGNTARASIGVSMAYLFAERKAHDFK